MPARAYGSIFSGFRFFGNSGSGEGSAGRAVHASHIPRKPTLPAYDIRCATSPLACLQPEMPCSSTLQDSPQPEPLPMAKRWRRSTNRQLTATIGSNRPHDGIICAAQPRNGESLCYHLMVQRWSRFVFGLLRSAPQSFPCAPPELAALSSLSLRAAGASGGFCREPACSAALPVNAPPSRISRNEGNL